MMKKKINRVLIHTLYLLELRHGVPIGRLGLMPKARADAVHDAMHHTARSGKHLGRAVLDEDLRTFLETYHTRWRK